MLLFCTPNKPLAVYYDNNSSNLSARTIAKTQMKICEVMADEFNCCASFLTLNKANRRNDVIELLIGGIATIYISTRYWRL